MRSSSIYSEAGHKSVTSDEWIDLEEEEEEIEEDTDTETEHGSPTKNANFFTRAANARQVQFFLTTHCGKITTFVQNQRNVNFDEISYMDLNFRAKNELVEKNWILEQKVRFRHSVYKHVRKKPT